VRGDSGSSLAKFTQLTYHRRFAGEGARTHDFRFEAPYYWRFAPYHYHAGEVQNYLEHFASSLRGDTDLSPDLDEGIRGIALLEAIRLSIASGQPVQIPALLAAHGLGDIA